MTLSFLRRAGTLAGAALVLPTTLLAQSAQRAQGAQPRPATLEQADLAWDRGDFAAALAGYETLLAGPDAARHRRAIALTTGELHEAVEIAPDGRALRLSPRGSHLAFETGTGDARRTVVRSIEAPGPETTFAGYGLAFAADAPVVSYVRSGEGTPTVVVRDLASGHEWQAALAGMRAPTATALSDDGRTAYALLSAGTDTGATLYALAEGAAPRALTTSGTVKGDLQVLPGGTTLLFTEGRRTRATPPPAFALLATGGSERRVAGHAPSASADGAAVTYLERAGDTTHVRVLRVADGRVTTAASTTDRVDMPALSPDGRTVAYMRMPRDDWEIFLAPAEGGSERRLTREIQHDLMPRFLTNDRILAVMGEARHRRSYLYDVRTGERTRLFHNNTVRTIAPEYEWAATTDGTRVAIVAERDGDTISPERAVHVTELRHEVTTADLLARLRRMRAGEAALRAQATAMFAPIAERVRAAVAEVSMGKLYEYQQRLSEFDSRYVGRPGNVPAGQWLHDTFAAMGYDAELQWFEPMGLARTANVLATLPGTTHPELVYVVSAHYDSHQNGPGADDDATGTAMLLELARVLKSRPLPATVVFAAFTGEEAGLLGSREYVRQAVASGMKLAGALNNDMFGWSNDHRLDNTIRYSNAGIRDVQHAGALLFSGLVTYDAKYYKNTDAHAYYEAYGDVVGGIGSYPVLGNPHYHQSHDILETINHEQVLETTKATLASLMLLAASPERLRDVTVAASGGATEVRWSPAREKDVRGYRVRYTTAAGAERTIDVTEPRARLTDAKAGAPIMVQAVNRAGLGGWDWAVAK